MISSSPVEVASPISNTSRSACETSVAVSEPRSWPSRAISEPARIRRRSVDWSRTIRAWWIALLAAVGKLAISTSLPLPPAASSSCDSASLSASVVGSTGRPFA